MQHESVYDILGLAENAGPDDVKKAYRRLAIKWHPGHGTGRDESAADQFRRAASAFKVLSDPTLRLAYDRKMREAARATVGDAPSPMPQPPLVSFQEATTLFFEQLIDQAFELAARGFNERAIARVLEGLGCTEKEALTAAATALRSLSTGGSAPELVVAAQDDYPPTVFVPLHHEPPSQPRESGKPFDIDTASWEEAMPYYEAVIVGNDPWRALSEEEIETVSGRRAKLFISALIAGFVVGLVLGMGASDAKGVMTGALLGPAAVLILAYVAEGWLIRDVRPYLTDKRRKYYLGDFEKMHNKSTSWTINVPALLLNVFWYAYRRMPFHAATWMAASIVYVIALGVIGEPNNLLLNFVFWLAIGVTGMTCYFRQAKAYIRKVMMRPADAALTSLRDMGGVNRWSWIILCVLQIAACVAIVGMAHMAAA